jgi:pimeloyl-ACP methyl ester carboxylesterase
MPAKLAYCAGLSRNGLPYVRVGNDGDPLVIFTSGSPDNSVPRGIMLRIFAGGARRFAEQYAVYFVKRKQGLPVGYTTENMADDYAAMILQDLGGPCHIIGISAGGFIAEHFAVKYPELIKKLVIAIAGYQLRGAGRQRVFKWRQLTEQQRFNKLLASMYSSAIKNRMAQLVVSLVATVIGSSLTRHIGDARDFLVTLDALLAHDAQTLLSHIQAPVLIVGGADDMFYPPEMLREMGEQIPGSQVLIYQGVGHGLLEFRKRDFERDVMRFLQE